MNLKGSIGEGIVIRELNKLPRKEYLILNDILLKKDEYYAQIDHIVISIYGIYLIETKNWSGKIYGDQYSQYWKKYINGNEILEYNPVKQNWTHKRNFVDILERDLKNIPVRSIIVFTGDAEMVQVHSDVPVIKVSELNNYLSKYQENIIDEEKAMHLFNIINELNILDEDERTKHIKQIKAPYQIKKETLPQSAEIINRQISDKKILNRRELDIKKIIANPLKRVLAALIDTLPFLIAISIHFIVYVVETENGYPSIFNDLYTLIHSLGLEELYLTIILITLIIQLGLLTMASSIGKLAMQLKVMDISSKKPISFWKMILRESIGKGLSSAIYYFGYILIIFTKNRQGLHDKLFETIVVDLKKYRKMTSNTWE